MTAAKSSRPIKPPPKPILPSKHDALCEMTLRGVAAVSRFSVAQLQTRRLYFTASTEWVYAICMVLAYEGVTYGDIAKHLHRTIDDIKSYLKAGRERLKDGQGHMDPHLKTVCETVGVEYARMRSEILKAAPLTR